jgi:hypothetical protein
MREVLRTNDLVRLNWAEAILADAAIPCFVFDSQIAAIEGSISAFERRLMVADCDAERAVALLHEEARAQIS